MTISFDLVEGRDHFYLGRTFTAETFAVPTFGPPFTIRFNAMSTALEQRIWNVSFPQELPSPVSTTFGRSLLNTQFQLDRGIELKDEDQVNLDVEIREGNGTVLDTGEITLPWSWPASIYPFIGFAEFQLNRLVGQLAPDSDLMQAIYDAVYRRFPHA